MSDVESYLRQYVDFADKYAPEGNRFGSYEAFILHYGRPMPSARRRPANIRKRAYKNCFQNASELWFWDDSYTYCEGYASGRSGFPVLHAWVLDPDGNVIDNTWKADDVQKGDYFGVAYDRAWYHEWMMRTMFYGVLGTGDYRSLHELLTNGLPSEAKAA